MDRLTFPIEFKFSETDAPGSFSGYASVFGVIADHRDVVEPGAFKSTLAQMKARGFNVPMYINHGVKTGNDGMPAGVWDALEEDSIGLAVNGRILGLNTDIGKYKHELVIGGALRGMSIGYAVRPGGAIYGKSASEPRRRIRAMDLGEISLVGNPSNHLSTVLSVKSVEEIKTIREFEEVLTSGTLPALSAKEAKAFLAGGFKAIRSERDAGEMSDELADMLRRNTQILKG